MKRLAYRWTPHKEIHQSASATEENRASNGLYPMECQLFGECSQHKNLKPKETAAKRTLRKNRQYLEKNTSETTIILKKKVFGKHCYDIDINSSQNFYVIWTVCLSKVLYSLLTGLQSNGFCNSPMFLLSLCKIFI